MSPSRRALVGGLALVAVWAALAAWSGHLSPLARLPLLDGLGPAAPYRWVSPPPDLAAGNQPPSSGEFTLELDEAGVRGQVLITSDNQVTVIVADRAIAPLAGETSVRLSVDPIDPAALASPDGGLVTFGNAYAVTASYQPSGTEVRRLDGSIDLILLYPVTPNVHAATHTMLRSATGSAWKKLETTDSSAQQQAQTRIPGLGTFVVAGRPAPSPIAPAEGDGATNTTAIVLLVLAGCGLLVGIGFLLRGRGGT
ncbi:MAG: hypothetical protein ABI572_05070 [Actinomycetota bacterium]